MPPHASLEAKTLLDALDELTPEEHHRVHEMLRLRQIVGEGEIKAAKSRDLDTIKLAGPGATENLSAIG